MYQLVLWVLLDSSVVGATDVSRTCSCGSGSHRGNREEHTNDGHHDADNEEAVDCAP
jgi:hypothetical protein